MYVSKNSYKEEHMGSKNVTVIIPARNAQKTISKVVKLVNLNKSVDHLMVVKIHTYLDMLHLITVLLQAQ